MGAFLEDVKINEGGGTIDGLIDALYRRFKVWFKQTDNLNIPTLMWFLLLSFIIMGEIGINFNPWAFL